MEPVFVPEAAVGAIKIHQDSTADSEVEPSDSKSEDDFDFDTFDDSENSINVNPSRNKSTKPRNTYFRGKKLVKIYLKIQAF